MPDLFIDTERLRDLNSGLGQVCLHLGHELVRQRPQSWALTFLVPKGHTGIFGDAVRYIEASWLRKIWIPGNYECVALPASGFRGICNRGSAQLVLTVHDLNFLERTD